MRRAEESIDHISTGVTHMKVRTNRGVSALVLLAASALPAALAGQSAHTAHASEATAMTPELARQVERVRTATERFQDLATAVDRGWTDQYPEGCAASDEGAQAFHYLNPSLVDGEVDLLEPELFMYEPQADGSMELVGVDYVIPFDQWAGAEPPTLLGRPLMRNEPLGVWAIHIWAWRANPAGVFAPWNPDVSCEHAG
jgi:hypothetical protein